MVMNREIRVLPDSAALSREAAGEFVRATLNAARAKGSFNVALRGCGEHASEEAIEMRKTRRLHSPGASRHPLPEGEGPQGGSAGSSVHNTVFLFDVDNTLLDNDRVTSDLRRHLDSAVGPDRAQQYWDIFEQIRADLGYADYLGALQRYRISYPRELQLLSVSQFFINYPFANRLFPNSIDAVEHVRQWGPAVILSDGDVVFQPHKVHRSGLFEIFDSNVLIYVHKEDELADVERRFPAEHYVVIDDKLRILDAIKKIWKSRVTTVFVSQGHYARNPEILAKYPPADLSVERIGALLDYKLADLRKEECA
jgi:FMN phosphatase YigB (HAD superfamily)